MSVGMATTNRMSQEEMLAWAASKEWRFSTYYKFTFYFEAGDGEGVRGKATIGGEKDQIYRFSVQAEPATWNDIIDGGLLVLTIVYADGHVDRICDNGMGWYIN